MEPLAPTVITRPSAPAVGSLFAERYEVAEALGEGGMGAVYRVHDRELDEEVALKILRAELATQSDALIRFRREVKLARRVTHANVARTYDLGTADGLHYLTMELIGGESLGRRAARSAPSLGDVLRIAQEIATGLCAAHAASVIHRDLKPDNVMIAGDRIVLTDFGIASFAEGLEAGALRTGMIVGTPAYMAPEQIEGRPVDGRTDVYALGVLLYELITGSLPFPGETAMAAAAAKLNGAPPDPRQRVPSTPPGVANLVLAALDRRRESRLDAAQMRDRLEESRGIGAGRGLVATPRGSSVHSPAEPSGRRTVALADFDGGDHATLARDLAAAARDALSHSERLELTSEAPSLRVEGSVRVSSGRVRVRLRLFGPGSATAPEWTDMVEGTLEDTFALEDAVAAKVVAAVNERFPSRVTPGPTDPVKREAYAAARDLLSTLAPQDVDRALGLLQPLVASDPDPHLLALMSWAYTSKWQLTGARVAAIAAQAEDAALRALDGKVRPPLALLTLAHLRETWGDLSAAVRGYREALEANPQLGPGHRSLGWLMFSSGRVAEGLRHIERSVQLNPEHAHTYVTRAEALGLMGDLDAARASIAEAHRRGGAILAIYVEMRLAFWFGDRALAGELVERIRPIPISTAFHTAVGVLEALRDGRPAGSEDLERPIAAAAGPEVAAGRRLSVMGQVAEIAAWSNQPERALDYLERMLELPFFELTWLDRSPSLERLRAEPRFARVRARVAERAADLWR